MSIIISIYVIVTALFGAIVLKQFAIDSQFSDGGSVEYSVLFVFCAIGVICWPIIAIIGIGYYYYCKYTTS